MTKAAVEASSKGLVTLGKITAVYGIKGWVKVYSHTDPMTNILDYKHWILDHNGRQQTIEVDQGRRQAKGLVAHIAGCDDRDIARQYCGAEIKVHASELPEAADDEIYWHELEGLNVITRSDAGEDLLLGRVSHLMETGANDVLVIRPCRGSIDKSERLVPWLVDQVIEEVNPEAGFIRIDWDPEF
ncbi:ribosome maturation factor RimM [Endozoicomonas gorgoniicola]|uniref:Ribosome maturation factor RimM n=1 Tax=Endozoicomonas gorgoniicola TaxID=1234144 RepID=A0ABT3MVE8_9GAMM|nr:ribosome maturation factor RimM [Endozoicomonas gorgoniicola]MCW7553371.1 ribosome maturation factor RimM [Endozoicomonas gorgoniicola]